MTTGAPVPSPLPDGAVLRLLELPACADAGPTALIRRYAALRNAVVIESSGRDDDVLSAEELMPVLRSGPDRQRRQWYAEKDGAMIGCGVLDIMADEGGRSAIILVCVLDAFAGRGIGRAICAHVESVARGLGVRTLLHWAEHHDDGSDLPPLASPTGFGTVPADRTARFLRRSGYRLEQVERASALTWAPDTAARLQTLEDEAAARADGYRVVQWMLPTPSAHLDGYARMKSRMSTDVPDADLDMPEQIWDADRVRLHEQRTAEKGWSMLVTAAEHIATGELSAYNELTMGGDPQGTTHQYDTLVLHAHRGHRLGMLVKVAGLRAWHAEHPRSPRVLTYNAEENRPMLAINETIGFEAFAHEGAWKKDLV